MNKLRTALLISPLALVLAAGSCDDATIASHNLSKAADNFEIMRRVVVFNGITDTYLMSMEGRCSIVDQGYQLEVTCKVGPDEFEKHFAGLSDNTSYFVQQMETVDVSVYHNRVTFRPQTILPEIDFHGSAEELLGDNVNN